MKSKRLFRTVVLGLVIVILLGPHSVGAQTIKSDYTATEIPTGIIDAGEWVFLPNGGIHFRGQVIQTSEVASDARASGTGTLVSNGNLDSTGTGPIWGTILIEVPDCQGGVWQGTWAGKMSMSQGYVYWSGVMQGVSGCVEGMMVKFDSELCAPQAPCNYGGTLLDPHGE